MEQGMPKKGIEFARQVGSMLRQIRPNLTINEISPGELIIDGRRLDLENLYRMVEHDPQRGREIAKHYLTQLFFQGDSQIANASWKFAEPRVMLRIQPNTIFQHLTREMVAHMPFVNNTCKVYVLDMPQMTVSLTTEQLIGWGKSIDEIDSVARNNLDKYASDLEVQLVDSVEGGVAVILSEQDGFDAARLLTSGLYRKLAPQLRGDFYVAIPARDLFLAFSKEPRPFVQRLQVRVAEDYKRLPYPITPDLFYVTRDGVAGTSDKEPD